MFIGLGTASFGTSISEKDSFKILDLYAEYGGRIIDTANNYAFWNGNGGESETVIGKWLKSAGRKDFQVHTKVGAQPLDRKSGRLEGLSLQNIQSAITHSLERLQLDSVDLLYAHADDPHTPLAETWQTFSALKNSGYARKIGISNYSASRISELIQVIKKDHLNPFEYAQYRYTVIDPLPEADFGLQIPMTSEVKKALESITPLSGQPLVLVAYSPLLNGCFEKEHRLPEQYDSVKNNQTVQCLREEAEKLHASSSALVLKKIADEGILPLTMTGNPNHLKENLKFFI